MTAPRMDRLDGAKHGALIGLVAGAALAAMAEAGAAIIRNSAFMADVAIVGFTAVYGLPGSVVLGSLLGWWGRPQQTKWLALAVAIPAGLVAVAQVVLQALSL